MKKCISCQAQIDDGAVFCHVCGTKQDANSKKKFPITARAFCRIFRPSFFGGFKQDSEVLLKFITDFLCLSREITDREIAEINNAFDILINNIQAEYNIQNRRNNYKLSADKRIQLESEIFRYDFVGDNILGAMSNYNKNGLDHIPSIWLFSLLAALDGVYSDEKFRFFSRIKNRFPISKSDFLNLITSSADFDFCVKELLYFTANEELKSAKILDTRYSSKARLKLKNGKTEELSLNDLKKEFPPEFDFYALVEERTKALCDLEYKIQELEHSEGKYSEIANKIEELARQERSLTEKLPGFTYEKF